MKVEHIHDTDSKIKNFGYGEWVEEPDFIQFDYKNVQCVILRTDLGSLCGYILLTQEHPWYKKDYNDIEADAYGGLSYSGQAGEYWAIGFDCAHSHDLVPGIKKDNDDFSHIYAKYKTKDYKTLFERSYKNIDFVMQECKSLVEQSILIINIK